jgi:co-chaperonin GroES (HSP10)
MILKDKTTSSNSTPPKIKLALEEKYKKEKEEEINAYERLKTKESEKLPKPTLLFLGAETLERQQVASTCGLVLSMGPHCYDKEKFPEGPWCKKGDWVVFARYAGSRIQIDGGEVRLLNDDEVLATIENPEDILHQY